MDADLRVLSQSRSIRLRRPRRGRTRLLFRASVHTFKAKNADRKERARREAVLVAV